MADETEKLIDIVLNFPYMIPVIVNITATSVLF